MGRAGLQGWQEGQVGQKKGNNSPKSSQGTRKQGLVKHATAPSNTLSKTPFPVAEGMRKSSWKQISVWTRIGDRLIEADFDTETDLGSVPVEFIGDVGSGG